MDQNTSLSPLRIDLFSLPEYIPAGYRPDAVLFIDVLRATTTITAALEAGVKKIIPVMEPKQAVTMKKILEGSDPARQGTILLGGERKGIKIEGFDLGNSPASYTPEIVQGKTLIFSTTNGTRAILIFERNRDTAVEEEKPEEHLPVKGGPSIRRNQNPLPQASRTRIFLVSFLNAEAVIKKLQKEEFRSIGIVCAGTDRKYTEEDILLSGLLVSRLTRGNFSELCRQRPVLDVQSETSRYLWETFYETTAPENFEKKLYEKLLESRGGENLKRIKLFDDIRFAARLDSIPIVPEYRLGEIRSIPFEES